MDRFGKCGPLWLYDQKLFQLKQLSNQTVEQYATSLKEKAEKAQKTDKELLSFFINGLRPEIKAFVAGKTPGDFAAAYVHAKTAEVVTNIPKEQEEISGGMREIIGHLHGLEKEIRDMKNKAEDRERTWSRRRDQRRPPPRTYGGRAMNNAQELLCLGVLLVLSLCSNVISEKVDPDMVIRQNFGVIFEPVGLVEVAHSYWHVTFTIPRLHFTGLDKVITEMPVEYPCSHPPFPSACSTHDQSIQSYQRETVQLLRDAQRVRHEISDVLGTTNLEDNIRTRHKRESLLPFIGKLSSHYLGLRQLKTYKFWPNMSRKSKPQYKGTDVLF
ncbi:uncharacterized protein [Ptychodera flava]|uniref:uncharacterized protein n=1 Tax=Ptychodera flava TaxID=63121 RepID=UPI00396A30E5